MTTSGRHQTQHTHARHAEFTRQEAADGLGRLCDGVPLIPLHVRIRSGTCMEKLYGVFLSRRGFGLRHGNGPSESLQKCASLCANGQTPPDI
jgi:hypothetical protein